MVGDGATDLAAAPPAVSTLTGSGIPLTLNFWQDTFIGFGGNQVRDKVKREADWFLFNFQDMTNELTR